MEGNEKLNLDQIRAFLNGSPEVSFRTRTRQEVYGWVERTLRQKNYSELKRRAGPALPGYDDRLEPHTGLYQNCGELKVRVYRQRRDMLK